MIKLKKKPCKCGCGEGYIWARGYIKGHEPIKPKPIAKISDKQVLIIKDNKNYYKVAIAKHIAKNNGKCPCEECGIEIAEPGGMNVSHIITDKRFYLDQRNHKILCKVGDNKDDWGKSCHNEWEFGDRKAMKVYAESMDIRDTLLHL